MVVHFDDNITLKVGFLSDEWESKPPPPSPPLTAVPTTSNEPTAIADKQGIVCKFVSKRKAGSLQARPFVHI